jgi:hypothetical protein
MVGSSKSGLAFWERPFLRALPYTGIFWPSEGTSQPVIISKRWKNPSSALRRKRTPEYRAFHYFRPVLGFRFSLGLPASGTDLKSRKGLYSGPSPVYNARQQNILIFIFSTEANHFLKMQNEMLSQSFTLCDITCKCAKIFCPGSFPLCEWEWDWWENNN